MGNNSGTKVFCKQLHNSVGYLRRKPSTPFRYCFHILQRKETWPVRSKRRIKTQTVLPSADTAAMLFWALLASGQISMRKVDGWQTLATKPLDQPFDLDTSTKTR
jgi:hypothetical protein